MRARWARACGAALACAVLAATQVRAEDPPKAEPPKPPVLRLEADKEYRFTFRETLRMTSQQVAQRGEESSNEQKAEVNWDLTLKLAETKPGVGAIVTLSVTSVKGWYESKAMPRDDFNSSKRFAEPMRVTLSPN
jgi:hypothetical protein